MRKKTEVEVLRAPSIAVIDDDIDLARAVSRVLKANYQCVVNNYNSVEDFLKAVDKNPDTERPEEFADLILLDFHLPGKNGPTLVEELKKRKSPLLKRSRIMGITADSQSGIQSGFNDAGIDEIILKPLHAIDFSRIANRAYRISRDIDSRAPKPVFSDTC